MEDRFRPFELLKLIRDGDVKKASDLKNLPDSIFGYEIMQFMDDIEKLGLIEITKKGDIQAKPLLKDVLKALRISLKQLTPYSKVSTVCSPAFGKPLHPPFDVDVFVLMPFTKYLKPIYDDHIRKVTTTLNLKVARADDFFSADAVISDIWSAINVARILIADCTGRNPNVFYELGIAHTLGKPVILISQSTDDIPFDIQHIRAIIYDFTPRGMTKFENSLKETLNTELRFGTRSLLEWIVEYKRIG